MSREKVQFVIIGNPENRRVKMFCDALERLGQPSALVVAYVDLIRVLLDHPGHMDTVLDRLEPNVVMRIESPGENIEVTRLLLMLAARRSAPSPVMPAQAWLSESSARALTYEPGRIVAPEQLFEGYRRLLATLSAALSKRPDIRLMNTPDAIVTLFDKRACHRLMSAEGVRVPMALNGIRGYDQLRARMHEHGIDRVFVKPRHGSSASGVVAYRFDHTGEYATSSTEMQRRGGVLKLFNSLKPRLYCRHRDIRRLIDALAVESVVVEQWIDKARMGDECFDVRIVVIDGRARHAVMRCARIPMTNLHLGNRRGSMTELIDAVGAARWEQAKILSEKASRCVSGARYIGVDVMFDAATTLPYIVELNAFGDLLPNVLECGDDTYTAEIRAFIDL